MIVDVHCHVWEYPKHFDSDFRAQARRARGDVEVDLTVRYEDYRAQAGEEVRTIVFGGKARLNCKLSIVNWPGPSPQRQAGGFQFKI